MEGGIFYVQKLKFLSFLSFFGTAGLSANTWMNQACAMGKDTSNDMTLIVGKNR